MNAKLKETILNPIFKGNPITVLVLGICSSLAVTVTMKGALVMALSVIAVCGISSLILSLLRNTIPGRVRIIVQLVVVAMMVILVDQILKSFEATYAIDKQLSVYIGLIITNCIPVVALQAEGFRLREILLEIQDVLDLGAAEGIDGLGIVAHHAEVPVDIGQFPQDQVLGHVRVLVLVHQDGIESFPDGDQRVLIPPKENVHVQEDVVEVHHAGLAAQLAIGLVHPVDLGFLVRPVVLPVTAGTIGIRGRRDQVVLGLGDAAEHLLGLVCLIVEAQLLNAGLDGAHRVAGVVDGEGRGKADGVGEFTQEPDEDRMERAHPDAAGLPLPHHPGDPFLHLGGGLLRKGKGEDP